MGRPVFYVLIGGLILAAVFVVATQIWSTSETVPAEEAGGIEAIAPAANTPEGAIPADPAAAEPPAPAAIPGAN